MKDLIIFRQYLDSEKSYRDLNDIKEAFVSDNRFDNKYVVIVQVGEKAREDKVVKYLDEKDLPVKDKLNVYHLSSDKEGLTLPVTFGINLATKIEADNLVISDSDFQFSLDELFDCLEDFNTTVEGIYLPTRDERRLEVSNYKLNRYVIEELENNFVNYKYGICKSYDFQSGLVILNKKLINNIDYHPSGKWSGNIDLIKDTLDCDGELIKGKVIKTIPQHETSISYNVQLTKFEELENKFCCDVKEVLIYSIKNYEPGVEFSETDFLYTVKNLLNKYDKKA